jgi:hypothetical protein
VNSLVRAGVSVVRFGRPRRRRFACSDSSSFVWAGGLVVLPEKLLLANMQSYECCVVSYLIIRHASEGAKSPIPTDVD